MTDEDNTEGRADVSAVFAELTALFEDAAALAAEGQGASKARSAGDRLARQLRRMIEASDRVLRRIEPKSDGDQLNDPD